MAKDYYAALGVSRGATEDEIKKAFRKKAHEHHPDKGGDEQKFKEVNEAYQVLSNDAKRKQYDTFGSNFEQAGAGGFGGYSGGANVDFDDLSEMFGGFSDIFGFGGARPGRQTEKRGRDMEMALSIDFLEAAFGLEKEISFAKNVRCDRCDGKGAEPGTKIETCPTCQGQGFTVKLQRTILGNIQTKVSCDTCSGEGKTFKEKCSKCGASGVYKKQVKIKVKVPAGINNGESIRLSGEGEAGHRGAPAGDLYLRISVKPHAKFRRENYDIRTEEEIKIKQAILGDRISVDTIHGPIKLKIPEGTQSGTIFKLKDKGIKHLRGFGQGDHFVRVKINIPKKLNKKQKDLVSDLDI